jgi:hypothetical protein
LKFFAQQRPPPAASVATRTVRTIGKILILFACLLPGLAFADELEFESEPPTAEPGHTELLPFSFSQIDGMMRDVNRPSKQTFSLEFGAKLLELRASYWEKKQDVSLVPGAANDRNTNQWGRYFDLLVRSAHLDGKLVGESEIAYSALGSAQVTEQYPLMTRLGANGKWGKAGYGVAYRNFGRGFVSLNGTGVERDRNESEIWGEYDFGLFRLRAMVGEAWERDALTEQQTFSRTSGTLLQINKPMWSLLLSSTYSTIDRSEALAPKSLAFANGLAVIYRPINLLALEPHLSFKQEWQPRGGWKIDTPSAGFALAYTPTREIQLIGRASFSKSSSEDPMQNTSIIDTTAGLNWKLGRTPLGDQLLALQFSYKNETRPTLPEHHQAQVAAMVQFKLAGF